MCGFVFFGSFLRRRRDFVVVSLFDGIPQATLEVIQGMRRGPRRTMVGEVFTNFELTGIMCGGA